MTGNEDDRAEVDRRFAEIVKQLQDEATEQEPGAPPPKQPGGPDGHDGTDRPDRPGPTRPEEPTAPEAQQPAERSGQPADPTDADPDREPEQPADPVGLPAHGAPPPGWRRWEDPDEEEHYVPPPPPPLPAGDLHLWGIVAGLLGGPLVLVLAHVLQVLDGSFWTWLGLGLVLGGFWLLWLRLPTQHDEGPHGGAQV